MFLFRMIVLRPVLRLLQLLLLLAMVAAAYGGYLRPSDTFLGRVLPLVVMLYPMLLLIDVLLLVLAAVLRSRLWIIPALAIVVTYPAASTVCPLNLAVGSSKSADAKELSIMSFNTYHFDRFSSSDSILVDYDGPNPSLQAIIDADPDIVCIVESYFVPEEGNRNVTAAQADTIRRRYPYSDVTRSGAYMVISKFPLTPIHTPYPEAGRHGRCYSGVRVQVSDTSFVNLVVCHLASIGLTRGDKDSFVDVTEGEITESTISGLRYSAKSKLNYAFMRRALQADSLVATLDTMQRPIIVCGDFNDVPLSYPIRRLESTGLRDAFALAGFGPSYTYNADHLFFRIDQMLVSPQIRPISMRVLRTGASDHYPVMMRFTLTENQSNQ